MYINMMINDTGVLVRFKCVQHQSIIDVALTGMGLAIPNATVPNVIRGVSCWNYGCDVQTNLETFLRERL